VNPSTQDVDAAAEAWIAEGKLTAGIVPVAPEVLGLPFADELRAEVPRKRQPPPLHWMVHPRSVDVPMPEAAASELAVDAPSSWAADAKDFHIAEDMPPSSGGRAGGAHLEVFLEAVHPIGLNKAAAPDAEAAAVA
jgi:hypothetical protein